MSKTSFLPVAGKRTWHHSCSSTHIRTALLRAASVRLSHSGLVHLPLMIHLVFVVLPYEVPFPLPWPLPKRQCPHYLLFLPSPPAFPLFFGFCFWLLGCLRVTSSNEQNVAMLPRNLWCLCRLVTKYIDYCGNEFFRQCYGNKLHCLCCLEVKCIPSVLR
jgi:hypothetical protein